jgi:peptidoglycan/LPS O-acetylase OafA/YrhL
MHDTSHRTALALLVLSGLGTALWALADTAAGLPLERHRQFMVTLLGLGLVLAAFLPSLRLPAIAAAVLTKAGFVAIGLAAGTTVGAPAGLLVELLLALALLVAGAVFLREERQEARWNGTLNWRPEA